VAAAKDGQAHTRIRADSQTKTLNPPIIDSITSRIRDIRTAEAASSIHSAEHPVEQVLNAAMEMTLQGYTRSYPERYNIGGQMDDIRLFCSGSALFDGVYAVDLITYEIQPVAKLFGLTTIADSDRQSSRHMSPMEPRNKALLWAEYDKIMEMKKSIREKHDNKTLDEQEISEYARKVGWYNNMRLSTKSVTRESRIKDPSNTCILLSKLIDVGIAQKIVKPTDCFIVFACRTHHDEAQLQGAAASRLQPANVRNMGTPATALPSKRDSHSRHEDSASKRQREGGSTIKRKRSRKLNKKTRRIKMRLNKPKSRKRKI
jgi:hypothetical protein